MANIMGIKRSTYNDYEQQYVIIPLKHLIKFCNYFNISLDYILGFSDKQQYENMLQDINLKEFGLRIRRLRKEHNMKQGDLALKIHTNNSILSCNERGRTLISTANLYAICKLFNISADYLLGRIDTKEQLKRVDAYS